MGSVGGRRMKLRRPSLAEVAVVVLLAAEVAVGYGASKVCPTKIKLHWYHLLPPAPLSHQLRLLHLALPTRPSRSPPPDPPPPPRPTCPPPPASIASSPNKSAPSPLAAHLSTLLLTIPASPYTPRPKLLFLLAGQSYMAGRGLAPSPLQPPFRPHPRVLRLAASRRWVIAAPPLHADINTHKACGLGPAMPFAHRLLQEAAGDSSLLLGLVPSAVGDTRALPWFLSQRSTMVALIQCGTAGRWWLGASTGLCLQHGECFGGLRFQRGWQSSKCCRPTRDGPKCRFFRTVDRSWQLTIKVICNCKSHYILCTLFGSKHGSDNASIDVRADLRSWSMLVLRFNVGKSKVIFLSPVKRRQYLRLKIHYPHRHRPIRLPRGAPVVLSECNIEDLRCFWRGQILAQRPRWRHHLCLLHMKRMFWRARPSYALVKLSFLSHLFDSLVVARKLQPCLGWMIPNHCTMFQVI